MKHLCFCCFILFIFFFLFKILMFTTNCRAFLALSTGQSRRGGGNPYDRSSKDQVGFVYQRRAIKNNDEERRRK
ncbi:hypothetical protein F4809DRAFT_588569 [Biscogniauxia mediterranea]|nr:hypothetical protein F4809DRAFT_588569 [Biscogniauxia mediterranea]